MQRWAVYQYHNTKDTIPKQGELMVVKGSPYFENLAMFVMGNGVDNIDVLCRKVLNVPILVETYNEYIPRAGEVLGFVKNLGVGSTTIALCIGNAVNTFAQLKEQSVPIAEILALIDAERIARQDGDTELDLKIQDVKSIAEGASVALTFDDYQQLLSWMDGQYQPPNFPTPEELKNGWQAYFRDDTQSKWYDAYSNPPQWRDAISTVNLSGYRLAALQDIIDAAKANLDSPAFSGIATAPTPDIETASDNQIATMKNIKDIWAVVETLFPSARVTLDNEMRTTQSGAERYTEKP